jgi:predicted patatin/cPLA2 family phospholipase
MKVILVLLALLVVVNGCRILSLSGGGSHGAFEAGVITKLLEEGNKYDIIVGVSAGSLNVGFLSSVKQIEWRDNINILNEAWWNTTKILEPSYNSVSLFTNKPIIDLLNNIFSLLRDENGDTKSFVGATRLSDGSFHLFDITDINKNDLVPYLLASSAIPVIFPPIEIDSEYYVDGGVEKNEVVYQILSKCKSFPHHIDLVLASTQDYKTNITEWNIITLAIRTIDLIINTFNALFVKGLSDCKMGGLLGSLSVYQPPNNSIPYGVLDFGHSKEMWNIGYNNAFRSDYILC